MLGAPSAVIIRFMVMEAMAGGDTAVILTTGVGEDTARLIEVVIVEDPLTEDTR
ncbi:hypothetical protein SBDP1_300023 [Syntrophobacter sp. SbD1]|nr:hypothetical protein SBDP1_300023 [Syntrophobacter sp. SbD1]